MARSPRYHAFIVSAGRTGTRFFGEGLGNVIEGCRSVHEPDALLAEPRDAVRKIRLFGFRHMVWGRLQGRTGIRNLSQRHLAGELDLDGLVRALHAHRDDYYASLDTDYVIESHNKWFAILPAVARIYPRARVVAVVRDPRSWTVSSLAFGRHFGPRDWVSRLGQRRLDPTMVGDREAAARWPEMDDFERLCWIWKATYQVIRERLPDLPAARWFRYEDLFLSEERVEHMRQLLDFLTTFPDRRFVYHLERVPFGERVNASTGVRAEPWPAWSAERARALHAICGPLMRDFGYGEEEVWKRLLTRGQSET